MFFFVFPIHTRSQECFAKIVEDSAAMKSRSLDDSKAFNIMGLLYGRNIIDPRQLTVVKDGWLKPSHEEFQSHNVWSFYNACTEALKSSPPHTVMERHVQLHSIVIRI